MGQKETAGQQEANAALAALAATGNAFALGQLWEINRGLLRSMFWRWYPSHLEQADAHGLTADDFEQEGYFAVQYAAQTYDPGKGFAFSTWLQQAMKRQLHLVLIGEHRRQIRDKGGNTRVISANPLNQSVSLDTPLDSDDPGGATLCDVQEDRAAACEIEAAEEAVFTEQLHAAIEEALQKLTEREADVIRRRYYGNQGQRQIAQVYGVSSSRVQQIESTAITKLRRNRRLLQWCNEVILSSAWRGDRLFCLAIWRQRPGKNCRIHRRTHGSTHITDLPGGMCPYWTRCYPPTPAGRCSHVKGTARVTLSNSGSICAKGGSGCTFIA